jgi:hypothetical protein
LLQALVPFFSFFCFCLKTARVSLSLPQTCRDLEK